MSNNEEPIVYKYNDRLYFTVESNKWVADRIVRFRCPEHGCELIERKYPIPGGFNTALDCSLCEKNPGNIPYTIGYDIEILKRKALALLDKIDLTKVKLVRLDDYYIPEIKEKKIIKGKKSDYFIATEVKTDADGHAMIVLYVGRKNGGEKAQFFIKPEKLQLSHDYKDMDPSKVLARIELELKDRIISQSYD